MPTPKTETTPIITHLTEYLENIRKLRSEISRDVLAAEPPKGFRYHCLEEFVLNHGRFQTRRKLPKTLNRGPLGFCYHNALMVVQKNPKKYVYTEGYAIAHGIPFLHAWLTHVDDLDSALDVTWPLSYSTEYFGVLFKYSYVLDAEERYRKYGFCLLDQWQVRWPLLQLKTDLSFVLWRPKK